MTETLKLELLITGEDKASKAINKVAASIKGLDEAGMRSAARLKAAYSGLLATYANLSRAADQWAERNVAGAEASARAIRQTAVAAEELRAAIGGIGRAAAKAETEASAATGRMSKSITTDLEGIRIGGKTAFSGIATSAEESSAGAARVIEKMKAGIVGDLDTLRASMAGTFVPLKEGATVAADGAVAALGRIAGAVDTATASVRALAVELSGVAAKATTATEAASAGGIATRRGIGRGPGQGMAPRARRGHAQGGGVHFGRFGGELPGGVHAGAKGNAGLAAAGIGGFAIYEAIQAQDAALRLALTSQVDPRKIGVSTQDFQKLLMSGAAETGDSVEAVAEAYQRAIRGTQGVDPQQRLALIKSLLPTARAESKLKGGNYPGGSDMRLHPAG